VLAFCSIVYELLLGQTLSAFLGNTVLRYSVTIGLYLLSMGVGALLAGPRLLRVPVVTLQAVEVLLTVLGGASVMLLFVADGAGLPLAALSVLAHGLIVAVGVLTGLEIPLLMEIRGGSARGAPGEVLGVDYAGAFLGTVAFALLFYPRVGIVPTAFATAALNATVGLLLLGLGDRVPAADRRRHRRLAAVQAVLLAALLVALAASPSIAEFGIALYVGD
jgi:spermidine synthase